MKNLILVFFLFGIGAPLFSQADQEMEYVRDIFQLGKAVMIDNFLGLKKGDMDKFTPIYEAYEGERRAIGNQRIDVLKKYAAQYENMTAEQADALVKEYFSIHKATLKLRSKYYNKVKKSLGSLTALSFLQFEEYIEKAIQSEIWEAIPFVEK